MDKLKFGASRVTGLFKRNDDGLHSVLQKRSTRSGRSTRSDPFVDGPQMEEVSWVACAGRQIDEHVSWMLDGM
jgi:hypothetical protein